MQQGKILMKNTALYAIANFGSKVLSFLIVPLYTHYLEPDMMGTYDLIITTITLLVPFLTFQMSDGIYRWLLDPLQDKERVIGTGLRVCAVNFAISFLIFIAVHWYVDIPFAVYDYILLLCYSIVPVAQQIVRGLENNKLYALSGIVLTAVFLAGNMVFVVGAGWGCEGMLISQILAYGTTLLLLIWRCPKMVLSIRSPIDRALSGQMMKYSFPLIPNVVSWWTINASNRYVILAFLGAAANGIFAVSMKFPSIIQMCTSIFYLAWQEAAIKEAEGKQDAEFTGKVFLLYSRFLLLLAAVCIPLTRIVVVDFMDAAYADAWRYCSLLYLGTVYSALSSFLGTGYQAMKKTKGAMSTTILSALLSVLISVSLTGMMGLQAISLSVFVSYVFMFLIRIKDCTASIQLKIKWGELAGLTGYAGGVAAVCAVASEKMNILLTVVVCAVFLVVQRKEVMEMRTTAHKFRTARVSKQAGGIKDEN